MTTGRAWTHLMARHPEAELDFKTLRKVGLLEWSAEWTDAACAEAPAGAQSCAGRMVVTGDNRAEAEHNLWALWMTRHGPSPTAAHPDAERFEAIGRAVVEQLMPGDQQAEREATPENVVAMIRRNDQERRNLQNSKALRVGRLVVNLIAEVKS